MEKIEDILERYYRGESSVAEERQLREARRRGELPDEPTLDFGNKDTELPAGLEENIRSGIRKKHSGRLRRIYTTIAGVAAITILIITIRGFYPEKSKENLQLSDNIKIERFEEALRVVGSVLEEKTMKNEKVLYEDNNIIITIE